jgi:hypothetical protein
VSSKRILLSFSGKRTKSNKLIRSISLCENSGVGNLAMNVFGLIGKNSQNTKKNGKNVLTVLAANNIVVRHFLGTFLLKIKTQV